MANFALSPHQFVRAGPPIADLRDRAPWWGGDLQTLRNQLVARPSPLPGRSRPLEFKTSDDSGDRLTGILEAPAEPRDAPLLVLIHGLTGCADSSYVRETARFHLARGRPVLRLNLRGAGTSRTTARGYYHAGSASDLQDVLDGLDPTATRHGIVAIGYSLGGNVLLNLLARVRPDHRLIGAATVSAPIDPLEACRRLMAPRNVLYHHWLLERMKRDVLAGGELTAGERRSIEAAGSIYEFDDRFVAPKHGFLNAPDYYERTAGRRQVPAITVPTLMLHACNDPWIPAASYRALWPSLPPRR